VASNYQIYSLNTGVYIQEAKVEIDVDNFDPERQTEVDEINYGVWALQVGVWGLIVVIVKIILYLLQLTITSHLETMTTVLIGWLNIYPHLKLVLIMVIIPFIFNSIQFWIQDNMLKADKKKNIIFHIPGRMLRSLTVKPVRSGPNLAIQRISKRSESV